MKTALPHEPVAARQVHARVVLGEVPQAASRITTSNRRVHRRLGPRDFAWLRTARLKYGSQVAVVDISAGGMLIETDTALRLDSKIVLELASADQTRLVACRVLRCDPVERAEPVRYRTACAFMRPLDLRDLIADTRLSASVAGDIVAGLDAPGARRPGRTTSETADREAAIGVSWQKVIVRYRDGRLIRGYTNNFHKDRTQLHLSEQPGSGEAVMVPLSLLKALFFVRDFAGDPQYVDQRVFQGPSPGRKVEVTFQDGEVLVGSTVSYRYEGHGFFLHPADVRSNNLRVFAILGAIQHLRFL